MPSRIWSRPLVLAALVAGALAGPFGLGHASAQYTVCRTDPVVYLSDGSTVDMTATIATSASDTKSIVYTLHAPAGISVLSVVYTQGALGSRERLNFYADAAAGSYTTDTVATTGTSAVAVTASSTAYIPAATPKSGSASGTSGQDLIVQLS